MNTGRYNEAIDAFEELGNFKDSSALAAKCQKIMNYEKAKVLFDAGNYEEAETLFKSAGDYRDASQLAVQSSAQVDYAEAKLLMESGDYVAAKIASPLDSAIIPERDELISECDNMGDYLAARNC